jgi:predicted unusual protein kinase regulating ubiquinone biosynthesis (AarF/ABC1/UbiB family)
MTKPARPLAGAAASSSGTAIGLVLQRLFPTTTAKGRMLRLAGLTAGVTGSYVGYMVQRLFLGEEQREKKRKSVHAHTGRRIRDELMTLRGPAMKFGQALSLHTDILPEEILAELSKLQMESPGMHASLAEAQFKASLGRAPDAVFKSFEPEPFAAASLGQVHRAVLGDGTPVAVKIQYPQIRAAIENDFKWLRNASLPALASGHVQKSSLDEMESQILAETDYVREADHLEFFKKGLAPLGFVTVPEVYREHSTDRVLTMSMAEGTHLDAFLATKPSQKLRDVIGSRLLELFKFQLLALKKLHADPHWGNYLFKADGTISLIDFGCVKEFEDVVIERLRKGFLYPGRFESPEFQQILREQIAQPGTKVRPAVLRAMTSFAARFYRRVYPPDRPDDWTFDFSDERFLRDFAAEAGKIVWAKTSAPQYIFMLRAEVGLYTTLHRLRARVPTSAIIRRRLDAKRE